MLCSSGLLRVSAPLSAVAAQDFDPDLLLAASGRKLGRLELELPWRFGAAFVRHQMQDCLLGLSMVQADQMPVFQYLTAEARSACRDGILPITRLNVAKPCIETEPVIMLVASTADLVNLRMVATQAEREMCPGWRKPRKELRCVCAELPLPELRFDHMPAYRLKGRFQLLTTADVRHREMGLACSWWREPPHLGGLPACPDED